MYFSRTISQAWSLACCAVAPCFISSMRSVAISSLVFSSASRSIWCRIPLRSNSRTIFGQCSRQCFWAICPYWVSGVMFWPWCCEQVKLPVQILVIVSDCHASFVGFGAPSKPWSFLIQWNRSTPLPRELTQFHTHLVAYEMPLFWKQGLFRNAKDLGEEFNLLAVCRTAQRLYVRQDVAGHIDISEQLQLGDQLILRPASLIA